jgi:phosphoribosylaminoimidazole (AIR) synthetase
MLRTFNMGIGLIVVCGAEHADLVLTTLAEGGERHAVRLGDVRPGDPGVTFHPGV